VPFQGEEADSLLRGLYVVVRTLELPEEREQSEKMDGLSREDLDRLHFFQVTREEAEEVYKHSPEDADVSLHLPSVSSVTNLP
jgi:hypothetical protein